MTKFRDKWLRDLEPAAPGRRDTYWDESLSGLCVRVTDRGVKSFSFRYQPLGHSKKVKRRVTLGRFPGLSLADARDMARDLRKRVQNGDDPVKERKEAAALVEREANKTVSFGNFAAIYIEQCIEQGVGLRRELAPHTKAMAKGIINNHILPRWRDRPMPEIGTSDALDLLADAREAIRHGPRTRANGVSQYNRVRIRLSHMWDWGHKAAMRKVPKQRVTFWLIVEAPDLPSHQFIPVLTGHGLKQLHDILKTTVINLVGNIRAENGFRDAILKLISQRQTCTPWGPRA